jgi:hypothetical protein
MFDEYMIAPEREIKEMSTKKGLLVLVIFLGVFSFMVYLMFSGILEAMIEWVVIPYNPL